MEGSTLRSKGRETRLLLAIIAVSVGTLVLLARFRFPADATQPADPVSAPLERLAARATFDELASIMSDLERRIAPSVAVLAVRTDAPGTVYVPALRLTDDRAVALVGKDEQIRHPERDEPLPILARDAARDLVVVQVPAAAGSAAAVRTGAVRQGPGYVAVVEGTRQGPAIRPVYVGRTDVIQDPRGTGPLYTVGAAQQTLTRGSAVFSLDGTFVGLASEASGFVSIVPAEALRKFVEGAPVGASAPGDLGVQVQTLSPAMARAARVATGVIVSYVDPAGPAAGTLQPGDVIQSIDSIPITTVAGFQVVAQTRQRGTAVTLGVIRRGSASSLTVTAADGTRRTPPETGGIGAVLRDVPRAGVEIVTVTPDSPAARAGLLRGDIITSLDGRAAPTGATLERAFRSLENGGALLLTFQRGGQHRILAVEKR